MNEKVQRILANRREFVGGEQAKVTPRVLRIAEQFLGFSLEEQFVHAHQWIFDQLTILPYIPNDPEVVAEEANRRWKLTADELLEVGTIYDGKYCNDVANLFNSLMLALGHNAQVAKVFKQNEAGDILVHSLSLIRPTSFDMHFAINAGSRDKYWQKAILGDCTKIDDWVVWKVARDQWEMGLYDSSQEETTIVADASTYYARDSTIR